MQLKILSWNIWVDGNFGKVANFLEQSNADMIGLQEVVDDDSEHDTFNHLNSLGYRHAYAAVKKTWDKKTYSHGPAVFSKHDILGTRSYILSEQSPCVAIRADVQVAGQTLHIFSTHLVHTHQEPSREQEKQATRLLEVLPKERTILLGDFNATSDSTTIRKIKTVLNDTNPAGEPTWGVYPEGCRVCNPKGIDTRLDYIFTSKDISVSGFKVENPNGSDHLPISITVDI